MNTELKEKCIYFAGYVDGEGCISVLRSVGRWWARVQVANTYKNTLDEMQAEFGGNVSVLREQKKNHRKCYQWHLTGKENIINFLSALYPFLREKKKQAALLIKFCSFPDLRQLRDNKELQELYKQQQEEIYLELQRLKRL